MSNSKAEIARLRTSIKFLLADITQIRNEHAETAKQFVDMKAFADCVEIKNTKLEEERKRLRGLLKRMVDEWETQPMNFVALRGVIAAMRFELSKEENKKDTKS